jgi:pimeloyl-ACP methyl ester carboxylesterase
MRKLWLVGAIFLPGLAFVLAWHAAADLPQRVSADGYPLRLRVEGQGSPTVVLEIGLSGPLEEWAVVQRGIAGFTRVAAYDRLGSKHGKPKLTGSEVARGLHAALANAGLKPPYILVGQSFAGIYNRIFASLYSTEVVGLVLLDPAQEEFIDWMAVHHPEESLSRFPRDRWPEAAGIEATLDELKAAGPLPNVPVIVVTGTRAGQGTLRDEVLPTWSACHANWVQKQPQGRHVRAEASGHAVHIDQPELVIELVHEVASNSASKSKSTARGVPPADSDPVFGVSRVGWIDMRASQNVLRERRKAVPCCR